ncbi:MAG: hypothetical protein IJ128_01670 [Firmicutes bacterium]|nr:hypothetical protein [Bacillota bacterium]
MKKRLLKPLLIGAMSLAMAFSASAAFADDTPTAGSAETNVTSWAALYSSMGLEAPTGQEGYYDAVSSATGIANNNHYTHIPTVIHQNDTGSPILDADGQPVTDSKTGEVINAVTLDGVTLSGTTDVTELKVDTNRTAWSKFDPRTLEAKKVYGTDKFTVYPDNTCQGYTWMDYKSKVYAVTISDGKTTVGALPWIDFYVENGHTDQVEIALNSGKVSAGCENGATVHRFDAFYTNGVLNPGTYTVSVYADGYSTLVADIVVPTWTEATVAVADADAADTSAAVTLTDLPADYDPAFTVDGTPAAYANGAISFGKLAVGSHTVKVTDQKGKYNSLTANFAVSTSTLPVYYDGSKVTAAKWADEGALANYVKNISTVNVAGIDYTAAGKRAVKVINADGSIDLSKTSSAEATDPVAITVTSTGYPQLSFTTGTAMEEPAAPAPAVQDQILKVTAKNKTFKAKALKKKKASYTAVTVKNAKGKVTYTAKPANAKAKKALTFKNGKITVKKKTKKGTYKIKVTVKAAAATGYNAAAPVTKTITIKVK